MRNLKLTLQYVGSRYSGWQIQPNGLTVQQLLQEILSQMLQQAVTVIGSGRTDAGVHALAQVAHFKTEHPMDTQTLWRALNSQLPEDIAVLSVEEVPLEFHAQRDARLKTYLYLILNSEQKIPFLTPFAWRIFGDLDRDAMENCLERVLGKHDFRSFCAADSSAQTFVREITRVQLQSIPLSALGGNLLATLGLDGMARRFHERDSFHPTEGPGDLLAISLQGTGFLKHMVRNLIGTVVEVGRGKSNVENFSRILEARDRTQAGVTAPAKGLFLVEVSYETD